MWSVKWKALFFVSSTLVVGCGSNSEPEVFTQFIEGTDYTFRMIPVQNEQGVFWIGETEVRWDIYDKFLEIVNDPANLAAGVDAITGPTPAYASVDRGYGRHGYPALSMSAKAADSYCAWLSSVTGRNYSIPTMDQWKSANIGDGTAWHRWNADNTTHPVGITTPNSLGIYDMRGNTGEWVIGPAGPVVVGGSFRTPDEELGLKSVLTPTPEWNKTDPQLPRSPWWLADADFVGLRVITVDGEIHE